MKNPVTVLSNHRASNLAIPMSYLEDNGLDCFLKDEFFGEMHPAASVELQVDEEDVQQALKLLIDGGFLAEEDCKGYSDPLTRFVSKIFGAKANDE